MKEKTILAAERRILPAEGVCNLRELGGYPVSGENGKPRTVKWGLLYRSGDLSGMTEGGKTLLEERGVRTVLDFRAADEKQNAPETLPGTVRRLEELPIDAGNLMSMTPGPRGAREEMRRLYRALPGEAETAYRRLFAVLAEKENVPILFHCSMGKDRTGLASALILYALGADMETIFEDYLESGARIRARYGERLEADPYMTVSPCYLEAALEVLGGHEGFDRYIRGPLGADIPCLRGLYTE
jgi:protein-tyrosine phosphatase